jgi:hypothetical protein
MTIIVETATYGLEEFENVSSRHHQLSVILAELLQFASYFGLLRIRTGSCASYLGQHETVLRTEQSRDVLGFLSSVELGPGDQIEQLLDGASDKMHKTLDQVAVCFAHEKLVWICYSEMKG